MNSPEYHHRLVAAVLALAAFASVVPDATAAASPAPAVVSHEVLRVGTAVAAPGHVSRGEIPVPAGSDPGYGIPVIAVNGSSPGPTLALVGGLHGVEFANIVALQKLLAMFDPEKISGKVIIIPLVNVAGFDAKVRRINPVDGKNMNRFFPGSPSGTQTERASYEIARTVIDPADYVIDYHGGDIDEDQRPYTFWKIGRAHV